MSNKNIQSEYVKNCLSTLESLTSEKLKKFRDDGFAEPGCNGPYADHDTPLRNTAHWCVTLAMLYKWKSDSDYLEIVKIFSEYLMRESHYGTSDAAICRIGHFNDDTNGVIGQAWLIEGLLACYDVLGNSQFVDKAVSVWKAQKYNSGNNSFGICCSDGRVPCPDITFNHNLWFAAAGAMILSYKDDPEIKGIIEQFIHGIPRTLGVQLGGKLYHRNKEKQTVKGNIRFALNIFETEFNIGNHKNMNYLESGYQLFDLFGFALLKVFWGDDAIFQYSGIKKAIHLGTNMNFIDTLREGYPKINKYGFPYNSPAFEYPFVAEVLGSGCDEKAASEFLSYQLELMRKQTSVIKDINTLCARAYELSRYCSLKLNLLKRK